MELELQQEIDDANVEKYKLQHSEELEHQRQAAERDQQEIAYVTETEAAWRMAPKFLWGCPEGAGGLEQEDILCIWGRGRGLMHL